MPRACVVAYAMEAQVGVRDLRARCTPLWYAAARSGNDAIKAHVLAGAHHLSAAGAEFRTAAGIADRCVPEQLELGLEIEMGDLIRLPVRKDPSRSAPKTTTTKRAA